MRYVIITIHNINIYQTILFYSLESHLPLNT